MKRKQSSDEKVKEITPTIGTIRTFISSTGTVLPKNTAGTNPFMPSRRR